MRLIGKCLLIWFMIVVCVVEMFICKVIDKLIVNIRVIVVREV